MKGIDIKLLRAFVTLAMKGSYSNAAKELFLTQPALSKQIQTLEHLTGGVLFLRGRHGASLTVLGQQLFSIANELLQSHIEFLNYAREVNSKNREKLFMGFGISSFQQVPKWIRQFHQQVPECEVVINHLPSSVQMKMLLEGRLHIGFVRAPVSKGLVSYILYEETLALAMPANSDIHNMNIQSALSAYPLLQLDPSTSPCLAEQTAYFLQSNQLKAVTVSATDDMTSLLALIAGGNGVAFLPASVRTFLPANVNLLMPMEKQIRWDIGVVWNPKIKNHRRDDFLRLVVAGDTSIVV
ncbi:MULTISPECIES: LysR family transcriptional regulator [unclassified Citrobacter]|uniref:LysR family transcriptional regulator n=1 Tax=unclassified Citrobacter TaxID=2644389 RepID=UPI0015E501C7|nr:MULTISPECIES: LysR family transcriptional regulator [unclassified Citrobacter]QLO84985.1 LysR family transcriptional regulator [Citrobacter sp. RHBSTW-00944]QLX39511.1 LysR family transcriptional regulator [Citrobacter sp. RHBSTW-00229]